MSREDDRVPVFDDDDDFGKADDDHGDVKTFDIRTLPVFDDDSDSDDEDESISAETPNPPSAFHLDVPAPLAAWKLKTADEVFDIGKEMASSSAWPVAASAFQYAAGQLEGRRQGAAYHRLSSAFVAVDANQQALDAQERCIAILSALEAALNGNEHWNLGGILMSLRKYNEAASAYEAAAQLYLQLEVNDDYAAALARKAYAQSQAKDHEGAQETRLRVIQFHEQTGTINAGAHYFLGRSYMESKNWSAATASLVRAFELTEDQGEKGFFASVAADAYSKMNDLTSEITYRDHCARAREAANVCNGVEYWNLGITMQNAERWSDAGEAFQTAGLKYQARECFSSWGASMAKYAQCLSRINMDDEAKIANEQALQIWSRGDIADLNCHTLYTKGLVHLKLRQLDLAKESFERANTLFEEPGDRAHAWDMIGDCHLAASEYNSELVARQHMVAIREEHDLVDGYEYHHLGQCFLRLQRYDEAIAAAEMCLSALDDPSNTTVRHGMRYQTYALEGRCFFAIDRFQDALALRRQALEVVQQHGPFGQVTKGDGYYHIGQALRKLQQHAEAADAFEKAAEFLTDPENADEALSLAAQCHEEAGNATAERDTRQRQVTSRQRRGTLSGHETYHLADALDRTGNRTEAAQAFRRASVMLTNTRERIIALRRAARLAAADDDHDSAIEMLLEAVEIASNAGTADGNEHYHLADEYFAKGDFLAAATAYRAAFEKLEDLQEKCVAASNSALCFRQAGHEAEDLEMCENRVATHAALEQPNGEAFSNLARAFRTAGRFIESAEMYHCAAQHLTDPKRITTAMCNSGEAYGQAGETEKELLALRNAAEAEEQYDLPSATTHVAIGRSLMNSSRFAEAAAAFATASVADYDDVSVRDLAVGLRARAYNRLGDVANEQQALEELVRIRDEGNRLQGVELWNLAQHEVTHGDIGDALVHFRRAADVYRARKGPEDEETVDAERMVTRLQEMM